MRGPELETRQGGSRRHEGAPVDIESREVRPNVEIDLGCGVSSARHPEQLRGDATQ